MSDTGGHALDGEAPVNPFSLIEAVNDASGTSNTAWLIFLGVMSYLLITVAGVTHKDLFLSSDIPLPILQVKIDIARFFLFAPILLVLIHTGVVGQLVMLARKSLVLDRSIRLLEATDRRSHPLRLELDNFFFVQGIAGPDRAHILRMFLHGMSWLTLVVLPVILLLYVQVVFLPYHDAGITMAHRIALISDVAMLLLIGTFLSRAEDSLPLALARAVRDNPITTALTAALLTVVSAFSLFVATVPGEALDRVAGLVVGRALPQGSSGIADSQRGAAIPLLNRMEEGSLFGLFYRNLNVASLKVVPDKDGTGGISSLNLRGRDLRFARLDRAELPGVDLTGANLEGASLTGADLRGALMGCADINDLLLSDDRVKAQCTDARGANFTRARMTDAKMSGIDLSGAKFEDARLENAELSYAHASGANFSSAHLVGVDFTGGAQLIGTNFLLTSLQGADLTGAKLMLADFSSAGLQGAILQHARLEGAILRDAELDGADLQNARLVGADLTGARIAAVDFRGAALWRAKRSDPDATGLADFSQAVVTPLDDLDVTGLKGIVAGIGNPTLKARIGEGLAPILVAASEADSQRASLIAAPKTEPSAGDGYKTKLTDSLVRLACRARWSNGAVATGLAKRVAGAAFRGDVVAFYDKLRSDDCPAAKTVSRRAMRDLATAVDAIKGQ